MSATRALGRMHYHHAAHEQWADRQLHFWFLTAYSLFDRDTLLGELKDLGRKLGIESYVTYELIGAYDLMIRLYLRGGPEERAFREAIKRDVKLTREYDFKVDEVARHWVWATGEEDRGPIAEPTDEVLKQHYPRTGLALLNDRENASSERIALIERYATLNLVREVVPSDGIKIVIMVGFDATPEADDLTQCRKRLCAWLDRSREPIHERSLYVGSSAQKQHFLVMCRIEHRDFHRIREWLIEPIGAAVGSMRTHTTTFPVGSADLVCFDERIALPPESQPDVISMMRSHELGDFEVKASLLAPVDPWLKNGKPLTEKRGWPLTSVLKGVVGLLNSGGGTMVIGAVEQHAYETHPGAMSRLEAHPRMGPYRILGLVDPTYAEHGWDTWDRKFNDLLRGKIDPAPGVLVQRHEVELEDLPVCVVRVDAPRDAWFYLREAGRESRYYARVGTSVIPLQGNEIDKHREHVRQLQQARANGGRG